MEGKMPIRKSYLNSSLGHFDMVKYNWRKSKLTKQVGGSREKRSCRIHRNPSDELQFCLLSVRNFILLFLSQRVICFGDKVFFLAVCS